MSSASGRARVQRARRDQAVVEDHVGGAISSQRAGGQQPGIAGAGADEVDAAARSSRRAPRPAPRRAAARARRRAPPSASGSSGRRRSAARRAARPPVGRPTKARSVSAPSPRQACAPTGVWQSALERARRARARRAGTASARRRRSPRGAARCASPARARSPACPDRAPARARRAAASPAVRRARAARARRAPARSRRSSPSASLRSRVSTLPRSSATSRSSRSARSCGARRSDAVPTRAPAGSASRDGAPHERVARRPRARGIAAITRPSGSGSAGTSLAECTARSISPRQQRHLELADPALLVAGGAPRSPVVVIVTSSASPPSAAATRRACASASALPRVPIRIGGAPRRRSGRTSAPGRVGRVDASARSRRARTARAAPAARPWPPSSLDRLQPDRRLVQQPLHRPRARSRRSARGRGADADSQRPAFSAQDLLDDRRAVLAQRGDRRQRPQLAQPPAKRWISSSTIASALLTLALAHARLRARPPAGRRCRRA